MDVITIDIGNSNFSLGLFRQDDLKHSEHVAMDQSRQLADIIASLREMCGEQPLGARTVPVVASSVNPLALEIVEHAVSEVLDQNVLLIGRDLPVIIPTGVENPEAMGSDRLLTASAAYDMLGKALVVADFGSAITVDCVNSQGIFLGGAILPGLRMSARALGEHTAALPTVEPVVPETNYGTNTESAIQCGIYYGALGALRELVERYANQLGQWPHVIVTGGDAALIATKCDFVDSVLPNLCLTGLYLAYVKFRITLEAKQE